MSSLIYSLTLVLLLPTAALALSAEEVANTIILDETGERNLKIETVEIEETNFEQTAFALGRIEAIPGQRAVVSSRIPGRIVELKVALGSMVQAGEELVRMESRQPGDPPPQLWLKAPTSGLVTECAVRLGDPVDPDKALLEITNLSEVYGIARVPEHVAGGLKPGSLAHIMVAALPAAPVEGKLLRFGTEADQTSGTLDAIFSLANPELALRPGMRLEFSIVLSQREGVMSVPRLALQGDVLNRVVYRKHYDTTLKHTFVRIPVQVGSMNDRFVEITSGLLAGDEVVTTGAYSLGFAGKGSISLKAALDAAHGHEHNEDGSEMTASQKTARAGSDDHAHGGGGSSLLTKFSLTCNVLLLALLVVAMLRKPQSISRPEALHHVE